jgi:hypothetical protein
MYYQLLLFSFTLNHKIVVENAQKACKPIYTGIKRNSAKGTNLWLIYYGESVEGGV